VRGSQRLGTRDLYSTGHCCPDFWMASCRTRPYKCGSCSAIVVPPSAGRAFWHSRVEVPRSYPALRRGLRTEHWAWKSFPGPSDRPHPSGILRSPHLRRYSRELLPEAVLRKPHNNSTSSAQSSLDLRRHEALAKSYLAGRTWKISA
jgi:hypothetical protein